jgi:hypothetical protein
VWTEAATFSIADSAFASIWIILFNENVIEDYVFLPLTLTLSVENIQESEQITSCRIPETPH